jgi:hypothetical protein
MGIRLEGERQMASWVRWLFLGGVLACWVALVPASSPSLVQAHGVQSVTTSQTASTVADRNPQHADGAGGVSGLTGYLVGLGLVLTMIALLGLRACERQAGGQALRRQRPLSKR